MPLTNYLTLGRSGLRVSPFCLGTMTFGEDWGWGSPVADSEAILSRYLELGGNFLDTANGYTKGHSEVIIGDYFARAGRRDRVVIATKFGTNLYLGDPNGGGASRKTIIESCEQSLRRLKTDYIDLYWMHFWDPHHADRRNDAGARRSGARGQGALPRRLGHAGVEGDAGASCWRSSTAGRRSSACRSNIR